MNREVVEARSEKKSASKEGRRVEAEEAEASEVKEQESSKPTKRSSRTQSIEAGDDVVIESVESALRNAKGKQTEKCDTRLRTATPNAKSAAAELQSNVSDTTLYYDTHEWMLPVEIGDRVVRKLSKEDRRLYSKVDEYDEFTGPWVVLDLEIRKRDKERIAQVLDNNISEEARSIAWNETFTALVKISIPEEAQTQDKVSPWVELRTLLPVLDGDGVQGGKLGPAYPLLEDFDSYKALKKKLAMTKLKDGSMNVVRKKEASTGDEDAESSLGLVNLRKNFFVAVVDVDPNWKEVDEYEVEKIRKKKLKLVLRSRATDDELDQEDTDKWQEILKHKTGNALDDHVIVVNWWVQWAGWPLESCTWEPRFSFGSNTRVMDYYNSNLDIFLDLPIEGSRYPLQLLFDYEDRYIEETRRVVAESRRVVKKPKPRRVRQKEVASEDEEERSAREKRERETATAMFADDEAPKQKTPKKRRPQMDDENLQKEGPPSDWDEELFGPWVSDSPE